MIEFYSETDFSLAKQNILSRWIQEVICIEGYVLGDISYIFCDDTYLHTLNLQFLNHDTFTDIISFDYSLGKELSGEIYISIDRVKENAKKYEVSLDEELHRVMIHGILHYCGHKDKTIKEAGHMRTLEDEALTLLATHLTD